MDRLLFRTDPDGTRIGYAYDAAGNQTSITTPSGTVTYTFDARNQMKTVTDTNGGVTRYAYDSVGNLIRTNLPNGTAETRNYDALNRLALVESRNATTGDILTSFAYTLDSTGKRNAVIEHGGRRVEYAYDALDRLTQESIFHTGATLVSRSFAYVYDAVGNRTSRNDSLEGTTTYTYDNNDRLLTETTGGITTSYGYDNNGNTVSKTENSSAVNYGWNHENQLVGADTNGDGTQDISYQYNPDGIRVSKTVSGTETRFLIDANRPYAEVLEELTAAGASKVSYVHGNDLIAQQRAGQSSYYHVDGLGSIRALSNANGVATDRYAYEAYGRTIEKSGLTDNAYLFAGEQRDSDLGLDYLRARYLNIGKGRFFSRDSFSGFLITPVSRHTYLYANNTPINVTDPSGNVSLLEYSVGDSLKTTIRNLSYVNQIRGYVRETGDILNLIGFGIDVVSLVGAVILDIEYPGTEVNLTIGRVVKDFGKYSNIRKASLEVAFDSKEKNYAISVGIESNDNLQGYNTKKIAIISDITFILPDISKSKVGVGFMKKIKDPFGTTVAEITTYGKAGLEPKAGLEVSFRRGFKIGLEGSKEGLYLTK